MAAGQPVSLDLAFPTAQLAKAGGDAVVRRKGSGAAALAKLQKNVPQVGVIAGCTLLDMPTFPLQDGYSSSGTRQQTDYSWLWVVLFIVLVLAGLLSKGRQFGQFQQRRRRRGLVRHCSRGACNVTAWLGHRRGS